MNDAPLSYSVRDGGTEGTTILTLEGPLTLPNMFVLQKELRSLPSPMLILDLSGVPYMDSAGLGLLMNAHVHTTNAGSTLLLAGVNDRVGALLSLTRVDGVLRLFPSVEAAEASL